MTKENNVEIMSQKLHYKGFASVKTYQLRHKLFAGDWSEVFQRELIERTPAAGVILYDPKLDRVVLIEQFRIGSAIGEKMTCPWLIEIVAGILDDQDPETVVKREAVEEANLQVLDLQHIADYWSSPGGSNEFVSLYCARVDATHAGGICGLKEEHEDIRVFTVSAEQAFAMVKKGEIKNSMALIALLWLELNRPKLLVEWGD